MHIRKEALVILHTGSYARDIHVLQLHDRAGANAANGKATSLAEGIDMSDSAHSSKADPDYEVVFPVDRVNVMTITISPEHWIEMYENMTELDGEFGTNYGQIPSLRTRMSRVALLE